MRKILFALCAVFITINALAEAPKGKTIDFNTPIKWNCDIIDAALKSVGLTDATTYYDVLVTYTKIFANLCDTKTFSLKQATSVCIKYCGLSDMLMRGGGSSGRRCPDICKLFAENIVAINNQKKEQAEQSKKIEEKLKTVPSYSYGFDKSGKSVDKIINAFKSKNTKTSEMAVNCALNYILDNNLAKKDVSCQREDDIKCNPLPGTDDYVYCIADGLVYEFVFDDVCDHDMFDSNDNNTIGGESRSNGGMNQHEAYDLSDRLDNCPSVEDLRANHRLK